MTYELRWARRLGGMLIALLAAVLLVACSSNPTNRWAQARDGLSRAETLVLDGHTAGRVSDETLLELDPLIRSARRSLTVAESQLPEGGDTFDKNLAIVEAAADELLRQYGTNTGGDPPGR